MIISVETFSSICWLDLVFIQDVEPGRELVCFVVIFLFLLMAGTRKQLVVRGG